MNVAAATHPFSLTARSAGTVVAPAGVTLGAPRALLRAEGAVTLVLAAALYRHFGGAWGTFAALFLLPDLSMLGYLAGPRVGAVAYNAAHALVGPAMLAALALATGSRDGVLVALIWTAHIGFDRALGYGLKYGRRFGLTHLGTVGAGPHA